MADKVTTGFVSLFVAAILISCLVSVRWAAEQHLELRFLAQKYELCLKNNLSYEDCMK